MLNAESKFVNILKALEGVTILEQPRVSRETIVSALKEHTNILREIRQEISIVSQTNKQVAQEAAENRMFITQLREESTKQQSGLDKLLRISDELRKQVSILNEKVDDFPVMKEQQAEQKIIVQDLALKFHVHVSGFTDFATKTSKSIEKVDQRCNDINFHIKEVEEYVNHMHETLILPASQIRVEPVAGFNDRPMSLVEVLSQCNSTFDRIAEESVNIHHKLVNQDEELSKKAPESIIFQIHGIERKVASIEYVLEREEDQGIGAVRRQCEQLTSDVQSITSELHDKIDKDAVSLIVHEKYDEIVRYLQDALQSSTEDEQNFKAKADELQDMLFKLANSKCDRSEIIPMQEMLVKTEAMLRKLSSDRSSSIPSAINGGLGSGMGVGGSGKESKGKEGNVNTYSKKEIEAMLELKVDKETFEQQIQSIMKIAKKTRRLSSVLSPTSGAGGNIFDQAGTIGGGVGLESNYRDQMMWKGLADAARNESDAAILKSQIVSKIAAAKLNNSNNNNNNNHNNMGSNYSPPKRIGNHTSSTLSSSIQGLPSSKSNINNFNGLSSSSRPMSGDLTDRQKGGRIMGNTSNTGNNASNSSSGVDILDGRYYNNSANNSGYNIIGQPSQTAGNPNNNQTTNPNGKQKGRRNQKINNDLSTIGDNLEYDDEDIDIRYSNGNSRPTSSNGLDYDGYYNINTNGNATDSSLNSPNNSNSNNNRVNPRGNDSHSYYVEGTQIIASPLPKNNHRIRSLQTNLTDDQQQQQQPNNSNNTSSNPEAYLTENLSPKRQYINSSNNSPGKDQTTSNLPINDESYDDHPTGTGGDSRILSSGGPQDLSFLGAQIAGGGFNLKTANLVKPQTLKAANGFADGSQDLEASGFLLKGHDGKMYYTDAPDAISPKANIPTAKKLIPTTRTTSTSKHQ